MRFNKNLVELSNIEIFEHCILDKKSGKKKFHKKEKKSVGFTGVYFRDAETFFAIYPTLDGPIMYFEGAEYRLTPNLHIKLEEDASNEERVFRIVEYDICIKYKTSPYIGFDVWSQEEDVDLFYQIKMNYQRQEYYKKFTR